MNKFIYSSSYRLLLIFILFYY